MHLALCDEGSNDDDPGIPSLQEFEESLQNQRITGRLRRACSTQGNAIQPPTRVKTTERLKKLRQLMTNETITRGIKLDAYIIPAQDEHQSEFVSEYDSRRQFVSGFSGSYGDAIVTLNKSVLWTDGRYYLQADDQMDCNWLLMRQSYAGVPSIPDWLRSEFPRGATIGADPKLMAESTWQHYSFEFKNHNLTLVEIDRNLVDIFWKPPHFRTKKRNKHAFVMPERYSGRHWTSKIQDVRDKIAKMSADAMIVTALDEIAWLLNIRGHDIPYSPFLRSYVILDMQEIRLFVNASQLARNEIVRHFELTRKESKNTVRIFEYEEICLDLHRWSQVYHKIIVPSQCGSSLGSSRYIHNCISPKLRLHTPSPIIFLKAVKNPTEIRGMVAAHIRDGAVMCEALSYFDSRFKARATLTELSVVKTLDEFRHEQMNSLGNSFRTIAAFGPNGALPHYEPTPITNARIWGNSTLVLDSGGQYFEGTTDVTRTLHFGTPTEEQKEAYTRVLIGQIQLSTLTFPENLKSSVADVMSRAPLWEVGLDYAHSTSHGVGAFLGVHEAPINMQFNDLAPNQDLKPGYFLSNEPGFYREGVFGVRLENVMEVVEKRWLGETPSGHSFLGFKVSTLVPYEPKLINFDLLSVHQKRWLNSYNERIRIHVGAELKRQNMMDGFYWMMEKTDNIPDSAHCLRPILLSLLINAFLLVYLV